MSTHVKMRAPLVSVVIPCYNQGSFLATALESVLVQTYRDLEVIVVDDGSADNTFEVATSFGGRVRVVRQSNQGLAMARNRGIVEAHGEIIAFLDADDRWLPHKLERQVEVLAQSGDVGLVHSAYYLFLADGTRVGEVDSHGVTSVHQLLSQNPIGVLTTVIPRHVLESVGLFDPSVPGCEDWDMWIRVAARWPIVYLPEPLAEYRLHQGNMSKNVSVMLSSRLRVLAKHRNLHSHCAECREAYRRGVQDAWKTAAVEALDAAEHAIRAGRFMEVPKYIRIWYHCPRVLIGNCVIKILARCIGGRPVRSPSICGR